MPSFNCWSSWLNPSSRTHPVLKVASVEVIQRRLPADEQERLEELRASEALRRNRCKWRELANREQEELIQYADRLEQWRVKRLEALMELAELRNIDLLTLNRSGILESHP